MIDWRAPVAVPFYRASAKDALGLTRRRQIMVDRGSVLAVADDLFGGVGDETATTRLRGGDALLAELERARTGEMLDIVATIQAEQDEIIRAPLDELLTVQGGPGTGKTAVGLHRAAFLLYNHPRLSRDGVLVLGPEPGLPALHRTGPALARGRGRCPDDHRRHRPQGKGARRGADGGTSDQGRRPNGRAPSSCPRRQAPAPGEDVSLRVRFARATLDRERVNDLVASIVARPGPYKSGRLALRSRLVSEARAAFRSSGRLGADEAWFEGELTSSEEFGALLDTLWPSVSPTTLVRDLLSSRGQLERYASGLFSPSEWQLLLRTRGSTVSSTVVERRRSGPARRGGVPHGGRTRSYGHIVVDEAQDLTPMQFRMIARRCPVGLDHRARRPGPGHGAVDLRGLGRGPQLTCPMPPRTITTS